MQSQSRKRSRSRDDISAAELPESKKPCFKRQKCLIFGEHSVSPVVSQGKVDELIMNYIVDEIRPLSTVEKPSFRSLVCGLSPSHAVMCRKTLNKKLTERYSMCASDIRTRLLEPPAVCTTADIWSCLRKSYIGVTAHWITDGLERQSVALACARIKGSHTFDVIAEQLMSIHSDYGLDHGKISYTVTDNGANMVKAFAEYQSNDEAAVSEQEQSDDDANSEAEATDDAQAERAEEERIAEVRTIDVDEILSASESDNGQTASGEYLPKHIRCASHTLNLLATKDFDNVVAAADSGSGSSSYKRLIRGALAKCSKLWSNVNKSTKSSDNVDSIIGLSLKTPVQTRWNATYDAIKRLMEPRVRDNLPNIMDSLKMPRFKKIEIEVLQEYLLIMSPITTALDKLQGEDNCCLGHLMPIVQQVKKKIANLAGQVEHSGVLADGLIENIERRFPNLFNYNNQSKIFVVSAVCHPRFKLRWLPSDKREWAKTAFLDEAKKCRDATVTGTTSTSVQPDDFFDFDGDNDNDNNGQAHASSSGSDSKVSNNVMWFHFSLCF